MRTLDRSGKLAVTLVLTLALVAITSGLIMSNVRAAGDNPLLDLLKDSGLKYKNVGDSGTSWIVPFDTDGGKTLNVFVTYNNDKRKFCMMFCTVVDKEKKHDFNLEMLVEAMKYNNDYPACKFVLDYDNGDIDVQNEVLMRTLTPDSLADYVNLLASMADEKGAKLNQLAR
jgi:hypothetical protein